MSFQYYTLSIPMNFNGYSFVHLKLVNIVVAIKFVLLSGATKLCIKCDNMNVVEVLTSRRNKDAILVACAGMFAFSPPCLVFLFTVNIFFVNKM